MSARTAVPANLNSFMAGSRDSQISPIVLRRFSVRNEFSVRAAGRVAQALRILLFLTADENGWAPAEQLTRLSESAHIQ